MFNSCRRRSEYVRLRRQWFRGYVQRPKLVRKSSQQLAFLGAMTLLAALDRQNAAQQTNPSAHRIGHESTRLSSQFYERTRFNGIGKENGSKKKTGRKRKRKKKTGQNNLLTFAGDSMIFLKCLALCDLSMMA